MLKTSDFGLSPTNSADENSRMLQKAVDCGGDIYIDKPGIYEISEQITVGDDTSVSAHT